MKFVCNFPTLLTLIRLVVAPCLLPFLLVTFSPFNLLWLNLLLAFIFILFGLTDFFDGYLARKFKQETLVGSLLDPLADKFLIYSVLIALLASHKIYFFWVLLLIGREIFVMGLRQIAVEHQFSLQVSFSAKIKTFLQIIYIAIVIANPYQALGLAGAPYYNGSELFFLSVTLLFSIVSAWQYYRCVMNAYLAQHDHTK